MKLLCAELQLDAAHRAILEDLQVEGQRPPATADALEAYNESRGGRERM